MFIQIFSPYRKVKQFVERYQIVNKIMRQTNRIEHNLK